ncbi:MAG TPA: Uma2 family endonuclease [Gemmataceae bacterium]|nr:Uma2 family endonuclease [Gemmataceae bacterium]
MTATLTSPSTSISVDPAIASLATLADLLHQLGDIPPHRVRMKPYPGTATEQDVVAAEAAPDKRLCELVDSTLVEKPMGQYEARVGGLIFHFIEDYLEEHDLGIAYPADAMLRVVPRRVRLPDVSFVSWNKLPNRELPAEPIADLVPDLAVEVLSEGNTPREMETKRREYFEGGSHLVWEIDPDTHTARVYTNPDQFQEIGPDGSLDGGDVLPGFTLSLARLFARAGRQRGA